MQQFIKRFSLFLHTLPVYVLVFVLFWCNAGSLLWSGVRESCYHYMRVHAVSAQSRDTIIVNANELKGDPELVWTKRTECRYKGKMFDVHQQLNRRSDVLLIGCYDKTDDTLFDILLSYFDDQSDTPADDTESSFPQWITEAVISLPQYIRPLFFERQQTSVIPPELFYSSFKLPVLSEPPDPGTVS